MPLPLLGLSLHGLSGGVAAHGVAAGGAATAGVATAAGGTAALAKSEKRAVEADATVIGGSDMLVCTQGLEAPVPLPGASSRKDIFPYQNIALFPLALR